MTAFGMESQPIFPKRVVRHEQFTASRFWPPETTLERMGTAKISGHMIKSMG